jgi:tRNA threonylcarbamoyl adenosine modification protein YeaZ/ribosomal-protein-alanine acetyltransferase
MVVLALDTATRAGSQALWIDGVTNAAPGDASRTHGERLPGELLDLLHRARKSPADVDLYAVVIGPGSFTGLRVGIAAIQGLALATARPVLGIPTFDAIAFGWIDDHAPAPATIVGFCLDGQRGDVFYTAIETGASPDLDDVVTRVEPKAGTAADAAAAFAGVAAGQPVQVVGSGAVRYANVFDGTSGLRAAGDLTAPIAGAAARLAAHRASHAGPPHALRPVYIRRSDAELSRARERPAAALPAGWTIARASGADDLSTVEALQRRAFTNAWGAEALRWELENTDVARLYLLRDPEGTLVAYCACWMVFDELHINSLAVDDRWRRRGLARELLRAVIRDAARSGAKGATLEVRASNNAARALYEGLGFHVEAVRRDYYRDPREDALILWNRGLG